MDEFRELPLVQILWPDPIRDEINRQDIEDMARSILASGQIQPIVVEEVAPEKYNGIIGRLRYLGSARAGKTTILCRIHSFMEDSQRKVWQLIENIVRRELNPIHVADGLAALKEYYEEELGGKHDEPIVESIQKEVQEVSADKAPSKKTIWKYLDMAKSFPDSVKKRLKTLPRETFGKRHAEQILRLKADLDGMEKMVDYIIRYEPTSNQLKKEIDDYLLVKQKATNEVKKAVENEDISLRHAAAISQVNDEKQKPILEITKKGMLKPAETKKVADFVEAHPEVSEILEKTPEKAVAIAEGKDVLETAEDVEKFFRGKKGLAEKEEFYCPKCNTKFTVDWKKGEVIFS